MKKNRMQGAKTHAGSEFIIFMITVLPNTKKNFSHCEYASFMPKQQKPISAKTVATGAFAATVSFQAENGAELPGKKTCFKDVRKLA